MLDAEMTHWMAPILMIPGLALLTISTANRINAELLSLRARDVFSESSRLKYLRLALTSLYFGITVNAVAGLIGGVTSGSEAIEVLAFALTCVGVLALVAAASLLVFEGTKRYEF